MRGGRRGGLWSEEEIASSGTGSERAQGRERSRGDPPASQGPGPPASTWHREETSPRSHPAGRDAVNIRCKEENDGRDPMGERLRIGDGKGEADRQTGFPGLLVRQLNRLRQDEYGSVFRREGAEIHS